jgi:hypothetical protein
MAALTLFTLAASSTRVRAEDAATALNRDVARAPIAPTPARATSDANGTATAAPSTLPTPPQEDGAGLRTAGYVAGGVGIVGLALFFIAGLSAKSAYDRLDEACGGSPCAGDSHQSDIDAGRMWQTAANIGLATGLVGVGTGVTLIVLGNPGALDKRDTSPATAATGAMINYGGRF